MRAIAALLMLIASLAAGPAWAQRIEYAPVFEPPVFESPVFEPEIIDAAAYGTQRYVVWYEYVEEEPALPAGIADYGPFRVLDESRAALIDVTDERSPAQFAALLAAFPRIATIEMIECPGTEDDRANLAVGRMIRARGIATHVPEAGSVRSGAVELFLAGARRYADPGAQFAVHAWMDDLGQEPSDYAAAAPENAKYLAYYRQMGMSAAEAAAFYAMTNSVPHRDALWLDAGQMAQWVRLDSPGTPAGMATGTTTGRAIAVSPTVAPITEIAAVEAIPAG